MTCLCLFFSQETLSSLISTSFKSDHDSLVNPPPLKKLNSPEIPSDTLARFLTRLYICVPNTVMLL